MRGGFREIVAGWMLIKDIDGLTVRIKHAAEWMRSNGPLKPDEEAAVKWMVKVQFVRGMPDLIRTVGMEREFGLPPEDGADTEAGGVQRHRGCSCAGRFVVD